MHRNTIHPCTVGGKRPFVSPLLHIHRLVVNVWCTKSAYFLSTDGSHPSPLNITLCPHHHTPLCVPSAGRNIAHFSTRDILESMNIAGLGEAVCATGHVLTMESNYYSFTLSLTVSTKPINTVHAHLHHNTPPPPSPGTHTNTYTHTISNHPHTFIIYPF